MLATEWNIPGPSLKCALNPPFLRNSKPEILSEHSRSAFLNAVGSQSHKKEATSILVQEVDVASSIKSKQEHALAKFARHFIVV